MLDARLPLLEPDDAASQTRLRGAELASVAMALPQRAVTNASIAARLGVSEDWIVERTGVRERRLADPRDGVAELAAAAGAVALERASLEPKRADLVLVATMSHEQLTPNAAPLVAAMVGAKGAAAFDVGAACTGFLCALSVASAQIEAGRSRAALVVGADILSRLTDPEDRSTAALFGDGAGAVVLRPADGGDGVGPLVLGSDGDSGHLIQASRAEGVIRMKGHETFREAVARMSEATVAVLKEAELDLDDIDLFVYHQANGRIISAVGERLGLPRDRVVDCVDRFANTSAASIPIALAVAHDGGRLRPGSRVLLGAFGGGLTWGAAVVKWGGNGAA